jgi:hypothetical protein
MDCWAEARLSGSKKEHQMPDQSIQPTIMRMRILFLLRICQMPIVSWGVYIAIFGAAKREHEMRLTQTISQAYPPTILYNIPSREDERY